MRNLDYWIAIHITKTLRRLTDEEYAAVVAFCDEANKEPHPHLELTLPWRHEGRVPQYSTNRADALELLAFCSQNLDSITKRTDCQIAIVYDEGSSLPWVVATDSTNSKDEPFHAASCASGETLAMAIAKFAVNLDKQSE